MKKRLIGLGKLLFVVGLMALVFSKIQWHDARVTSSASGAETTATGQIEGPWEADQIRFRERLPDGTLAPAVVWRRGVQADGATVGFTQGFLTYLRNLDPGLFALGALAYFCTVVLSGVRWWWLLRANQLEVSLWEAQRFTWIGLFFNNVVPGSTGGDLVKAMYIMKHCPGARIVALVSVIVDRVMGLGSLALLAGIVVLFALDRFGFLALVIWAVLIGVSLVGVIAFSRRLRELVRLSHLLNRLPARLSGLLKRVDQAVFYYRSQVLGVIAWTVGGMLIHVGACLSVLCMGEALGVGLPTLDYFVLIPLANLVSAVPIAPNGWGLGEALYGFLFKNYGAYALGGGAAAEAIMGTRGVALSVLFRLHVTAWSLLGGIAALLEKDKVTRADLEREQAMETAEAGTAEGG